MHRHPEKSLKNAHFPHIFKKYWPPKFLFWAPSPKRKYSNPPCVCSLSTPPFCRPLYSFSSGKWLTWIIFGKMAYRYFSNVGKMTYSWNDPVFAFLGYDYFAILGKCCDAICAYCGFQQQQDLVPLRMIGFGDTVFPSCGFVNTVFLLQAIIRKRGVGERDQVPEGCSTMSPLFSCQNLDLFPLSSSKEEETGFNPGSDLLSFWKHGRYRLSYSVRTSVFELLQGVRFLLVVLFWHYTKSIIFVPS